MRSLSHWPVLRSRDARHVPDLNASGSEATQTNLILPEPADFLHKDLPQVSVIRPTLDQNAGAVAAVKALTADQLFKGSHRGSSARSCSWQEQPTPRSGRNSCSPESSNPPICSSCWPSRSYSRAKRCPTQVERSAKG